MKKQIENIVIIPGLRTHGGESPRVREHKKIIFMEIDAEKRKWNAIKDEVYDAPRIIEYYQEIYYQLGSNIE
jgi:hypothetical protein